MTQIVGTYTSIRTQDFLDLYEKIGVPKDMSDRLVNSHWTMTTWKEGENTWGYYFTCKEIPELNCVDVAEEGVEKDIFNPVFGGKSKMIFTSIENGFFTKFISETFGEYTCKETYDDVGVTMIWECQGNTYVDSWKRISPWTGHYICVESTNIDEYFDGYSPEIVESFKKYDATFKRVGDIFNLKESFGTSLVINSDLKLDEEVKVQVPSKADPSVKEDRTALLAKQPGNVFSLKITDSQGVVEEWIATFSGDDLEWHGVNHGTGKECWFKMRKVIDITGPYKVVAKTGFLEFAASQGIQQEQAEEMNKFNGGSLEFTDLGDGWYHFTSHKGEEKMIDVKLRDGEHFDIPHPATREEAKGSCNIKENTLNISINAANAAMATLFNFRGNYLTNVCTASGSDARFITVCERE